tara:strand:- start:1991 stop:2167 length:177 start_codon:yes stop_codon:yes gene_type:complete
MRNKMAAFEPLFFCPTYPQEDRARWGNPLIWVGSSGRCCIHLSAAFLELAGYALYPMA